MYWFIVFWVGSLSGSGILTPKEPKILNTLLIKPGTLIFLFWLI
jgi:hypothetical protein